MSNVLGTITPIDKVIEIAHARGIPGGGRRHPGRGASRRSTCATLDVDFYVFTGHKLYGPTGIGVLYGKRKWLESLPPYAGGGEMIET